MQPSLVKTERMLLLFASGKCTLPRGELTGSRHLFSTGALKCFGGSVNVTNSVHLWLKSPIKSQAQTFNHMSSNCSVYAAILCKGKKRSFVFIRSAPCLPLCHKCINDPADVADYIYSLNIFERTLIQVQGLDLALNCIT